jgi:HD-GYP domain-containing protein (c-di-GMP phosphodiesterase class II)
MTPAATIQLANRDEIQFINSLFALFKTARYLDADNAVYQAQSRRFFASFSRLLKEDCVTIRVIEGRILVQDKLIKFSSDGMILASEVIAVWRSLGIGGIIFEGVPDNRQLDKFVYLITNANRSNVEKGRVNLRLKELGINGIVLLGMESEEPQKRLTDDKRKILRRAARMSFFRAINVVEDVMVRVSQDKTIDLTKAKFVIHSLIDRVAEDECSLIGLTNIRDFDEYTYAHCANVCVYSLTMGVRLGLDRKRMSQLGFAALFHDIGKVRLPRDLIRKPDFYDENDWRQMQQHPLLGAKTILRNFKFDSHTARAALAAFEHHINNDFTGYPTLQRERPTSLFSKIIAIADTFDALSSGRVYMKRPASPDEALRKMMYQMTTKFDAFLLKLFVNVIGIYPPGTLVLLSSDELAIVSKTNQADLSRPLLRIIGTASGLMERFVDIDLSLPENGGTRIVRIIDPSVYKIDVRNLLLSDR